MKTNLGFAFAGGSCKDNSRVAEKARAKNRKNVKLLRGIFLPELAGTPNRLQATPHHRGYYPKWYCFGGFFPGHQNPK
jgi:hypothetical protein